MSAAFLDYSAGRPSGKAIRDAGYAGVVVYVGEGSAGKRLTAAEYRDLKSAGLTVWFVVELGQHDVRGGFARGQTAGHDALNDLKALGVTDTESPIFCAMDEHVGGDTAAQAVAYARGFASVVGKARAGFYGFSDSLVPVHDAGVVSAYWLCGSKPSAAIAAWLHLWQDNTTHTIVAGIQCDINRVYNPLHQSTTEVDDLASLTEPLPMPVKMADGKEYHLTPLDVIWGLAQYIPGLGGAVAAGMTNHPVGQYVEHLLKTDAILTAVEALPKTAPTLTLSADQVPALAADIAAKIPAPTALTDSDRQAIATAVADLLGERLSA